MVVKRKKLGENSLYVIYNHKTKSKIKVKIFHIFLTALGEGEGGGGQPKGQAFPLFHSFFFEPFSNAVDKALKNQ